MAEQRIEPSRVTKPIQLLAAWLTGLVLVNGAFLGSAIGIPAQWLQAVLVIAAVLNVPAFLFAIFLLQTRYRPEMQEDVFYSKYLDKKTQALVDVKQVRMAESVNEQVLAEIRAISALLPNATTGTAAKHVIERRRYSLSINDFFPQFAELRSDLRSQGFWINSIFGSTNSKPERPKVYIISICDDVDIGYMREVLRVLLKYPFDGIKISHRVPVDDSDVYLGSYDISSGYAALTPELQQLVDAEFERLDIEHYCAKHWKKPEDEQEN